MISLGDAQQQAGDPDHREIMLAEARQAERRGDGPRLIRARAGQLPGSFSSAGEVDAERVATLEAAPGAAEVGDDLVRARLLSQLVMEPWARVYPAWNRKVKSLVVDDPPVRSVEDDPPLATVTASP